MTTEQKVDILSLPVEDRRRTAHVLSYVEAGSQFGLGKFEWDTIKWALREALKTDDGEGGG